MTISAKIIAHSKSAVNGKEIVTYELEYPRFIHAEFMTHRLFSRNAASSRAIPVEKMLQTIKDCPAMPEFWGKNQTGMQAVEECDELVSLLVDVPWDEPTDSGFFSKEYGIAERGDAWLEAMYSAAEIAKAFSDAGYHKQIVNRLVEPFAHIKVVCTATEYANFFHLRKHPDAQPEIRILAERMWEALQASIPEILQPGEWHTPYVSHYRKGTLENKELIYSSLNLDDPIDENYKGFESYILSKEDALKVSASMCAQVSYRKSDDSLEKAIDIYNKLVTNTPVHASPFEHQATPMETYSGIAKYNGGILESPKTELGVTHRSINRKQSYTYGDAWSGNFKGWIQHRQLIPNHVVWGDDV